GRRGGSGARGGGGGGGGGGAPAGGGAPVPPRPPCRGEHPSGWRRRGRWVVRPSGPGERSTAEEWGTANGPLGMARAWAEAAQGAAPALRARFHPARPVSPSPRPARTRAEG